MKRIVTIGGGTGQYTLLSGLKAISDLEVSAIVTMADSGGSSGVLRTERGALPPGDVFRCLLALATAEEDVVRLFEHRFAQRQLESYGASALDGHTIGNLALTAASEALDGDFLRGIQVLSTILRPHGCVFPVTTERTTLCARLSDGAELRGEHHIDRPDRVDRARITKVWLDPEVQALHAAIDAIQHADAVVVGPGDLFTSIIPNVLVRGMAEAIAATLAPVIFVVNIMTKRGETDGFSCSDFVATFEQYANRRVDVILCNSQLPTHTLSERYIQEGARPVMPSPWDASAPDARGRWGNTRCVSFPLLAEGSFARHDPIKLAHVVRALIP